MFQSYRFNTEGGGSDGFNFEPNFAHYLAPKFSHVIIPTFKLGSWVQQIIGPQNIILYLFCKCRFYLFIYFFIFYVVLCILSFRTINLSFNFDDKINEINPQNVFFFCKFSALFFLLVGLRTNSFFDSEPTFFNFLI